MTSHTVQSGESLSLISQKYFGDFSMTDAIARMNNITNKNVIYPGMVLELPIADGAEVAKSWKKLDRAVIIGGFLLAAISTYFAYKQLKKRKSKTSLSGVAKKSKAAAMVLKLMDKDYEYQQALNEVLKANKKLSKAKLEKELDTYI